MGDNFEQKDPKRPDVGLGGVASMGEGFRGCPFIGDIFGIRQVHIILQTQGDCEQKELHAPWRQSPAPSTGQIWGQGEEGVL